MRKYKALLKPYLRDILNILRYENSMTQKEMAHFFYISTRSYCDLERGKYSLSAVSLIILLAYLPNDVMVQVVRGFFNLILDERDKADD